LALSFFQVKSKPSKEGGLVVGSSSEPKKSSSPSLNLVDESKQDFRALPDEYAQLQMRILASTLFLSVISIGITAIFFDLQTTTSLLVGCLFGVLYLRLLARSIEKLGTSSKQVSKIQLLVPVLLVLASAKLPQLDLIPALLGFLLYKPSLFFQTLLEN